LFLLSPQLKLTTRDGVVDTFVLDLRIHFIDDPGLGSGLRFVRFSNALPNQKLLLTRRP